MQRRAEAARADICGDAAPLSRLATHAGDATFYVPRGGYVHGVDDVFSTYEHDITAFAPGGESVAEPVRVR